MRWLLGFAFTGLLALAVVTPAAAVQPDEVLDDPVLEERARELSAGLRCLVCQNQSIDDSDAPLARDLRLLVRERLVAGDTNDEALAYLVDRYGDFILLKPPLKTETLVLWAVPILALAGGAILAANQFRRRRTSASPVPLSEDEEKRVRQLLSDDG